MPGTPHAMPFGAAITADGRIRFQLWAPDADHVKVVVGTEDSASHVQELAGEADGWFRLTSGDACAGALYRYCVDGSQCVPDPASRFQPTGVSGPSQVIDPSDYTWETDGWRGRPWTETVLYELHVGTFTPAGTFESAAARLPYLADLGVTAVEVMPVSTFAGTRNWGYDGVLPFAPHAAYGEPSSFRRFVDGAHALGIQVLLDVVYNHFGPEGNYLHAYASDFFTDRHETPWGAAINYDGNKSRTVRDFFIHNALYWLEEYRLDGLRLDAVHAIIDESKPDVLEEIAEAVHLGPGAHRQIHLILENDRNEAHYLEGNLGRRRSGYAAQWNDDFHHACHTLVTGETDGYYVDYADRPIGCLTRCLREGFAYQGQPSRHRHGMRRGEPSRELPSTAFIAFLQNHDQVGNRAFGERLTVLTEPEPLRSLTSLMLLSPAIPALFMGEEFGCERPFLYFADFEGELAEQVRDGRRREFASFARFDAGDDETAIPDPMLLDTFERSILDWRALAETQHAQWLAYYRALLALRHRIVVPRLPGRAEPDPSAGQLDERQLCVRWRMQDGSRLSVIANLGSKPLTIDSQPAGSGKLVHRNGEPPERDGSASTLAPWTLEWRLEDRDR